MPGSPPSTSLSSSVTGPPGRPVVTFSGSLTASSANDLVSGAAKLIQQRPESVIIGIPALRVHLLPTLHSVEVARARASDACARWGLAPADVRIQSIVTELVVNAVTHARTPIELTFALTRPFFYMAVRDGSDQLPRRRTDDEDHGYGLAVVDAFASQWGSHPTAGGKVVWAAIRVLPPT